MSKYDGVREILNAAESLMNNGDYYNATVMCEIGKTLEENGKLLDKRLRGIEKTLEMLEVNTRK